jgi:hypothetical protein
MTTTPCPPPCGHEDCGDVCLFDVACLEALETAEREQAQRLLDLHRQRLAAEAAVEKAIAERDALRAAERNLRPIVREVMQARNMDRLEVDGGVIVVGADRLTTGKDGLMRILNETVRVHLRPAAKVAA